MHCAVFVKNLGRVCKGVSLETTTHQQRILQEIQAVTYMDHTPAHQAQEATPAALLTTMTAPLHRWLTHQALRQTIGLEHKN
jgi:hypothetical protein